jgi:hypothetical protein
VKIRSSGDNNIILQTAIDSGIEGLEVYHPKHNQSMENRLLDFCSKNNIIITGGTDFHGFEDYEYSMIGSKYTPERSLKDLAEHID